MLQILSGRKFERDWTLLCVPAQEPCGIVLHVDRLEREDKVTRVRALVAQLLAPYGPAQDVRVPIRASSVATFGYAFATLPARALAEDAVRELTGRPSALFDGNMLALSISNVPNEERQLSVKRTLLSPGFGLAR